MENKRLSMLWTSLKLLMFDANYSHGGNFDIKKKIRALKASC